MHGFSSRLVTLPDKSRSGSWMALLSLRRMPFLVITQCTALHILAVSNLEDDSVSLITLDCKKKPTQAGELKNVLHTEKDPDVPMWGNEPRTFLL